MDLTAGDPEQAKGMGGPQAGERATQAGEEALWVCKTTVCPECPHGVWDQLSPYFLDLQPYWFSWLPNLLPYISPFWRQWFSVSNVGRWLPLVNKQRPPIHSVRVQLCGKGTTSQQMKICKKEGQVSRPRSKTGLCVGVYVGGWPVVGKETDII